MDRFYYEKPSKERKEEITEYFDEFITNNSKIHGSGPLDKIYEGYSFEQALDECLKKEDEKYAASLNKCPGKTFLLIRESDNKLVGTMTIRWNLNEKMLQFAGHIGYSIRPSERNKGYSKINLYLALKEAKKLGLDKVMLSCNANNITSDITIKDLGGELERSEIDPYDNELTNVYWINVTDSLEKYKDDYEIAISNVGK